MKIPVVVYMNSSILCHSLDCPFRSECANHYTAGGFREEDGFSPEWIPIVFQNQVDCKTRDATPDVCSLEKLPHRWESLGRGELTMKDLEKQRSKQPLLDFVQLIEDNR